MKGKEKALKMARFGKVKKIEKQVYHRNHRVYHGKGPRGSGHIAGEGWGEAKKIDPSSTEIVYSKRGRSPSFDQGVRNYKVRAHNKALTDAKIDKFFKKI